MMYLAKKSYSLIYTCLLSLAIIFSSCIKSEFDEPPFDGLDPEIQESQIISLEEVLSRLEKGNPVELALDKYLKTVVVADDKTGNWFRAIVVQDEKSERGITVLIDEVENYTSLPVGRRVFIHLKDLWIGDYNGLPQLGMGPYQSGNFLRLGGIPASLKPRILLAGKYGINIPPTPKKISELTDADLNRLLIFDDVQFESGSAGRPFADNVSNPPQSINHTLVSCTGEQILVRTSGYSDFAGQTTPVGRGSIVAIMSVFGNDRQLLIRNPDELVFDKERCDAPKLTIAQIRDLFLLGTTTAPQGMIEGVVISDRSSGNFTGRNLHLQDETGGIVLRFNTNHNFDLGDRLLVDITGQSISTFNGLLQLNLPNNTASVIGNQSLPEPAELTVQQIISNMNRYESTRVRIKNATISGGTTFGGSRNVTDGTGGVTLFTGNGASFASNPIPSGQVEITGIVSVFNDPQILLNSANDVKGGSSGGDTNPISIREVRNLFNGTATTAPEAHIEGVVISSNSSNNINARNLYIQDNTGGIVVRFEANHNFSMGTKLKVVISGQEISEFRGLLQLNNVPLTNATALGSTALPSPKNLTIQQLLADINTYQSTRIKISNATISGGTTFGGSREVSDGTGTIVLFTSNNATFANNNLPTGMVDIIAIASAFDSPQIIINSTDDISGGGGTGGGVEESFNSGSNNQPINITNWVNEATKGTRTWIRNSFQGNNFAQASAFNDTNPETEMWLITPEVNTDNHYRLSFKSAQAFFVHNGLEVFATADFTGNVGTTSWVKLNPILAGSANNNYDWVESGEVNLKSIGQNVRVAFKYSGKAGTETTTFRIDDVIIR